MRDGHVALVLHAHLPFVRHPEYREFLEERWLFEAVTESYLPLLDVFDGLERDGVPARLTVSLSPTLLAMLADPLLRERYRRHLDALIELSERETTRTRMEPHWHRCAVLYRERLQRACARFLGRWRQDLVAAFRGFEERGRLELATTAATHAVLPLLSASPACVRAQIATGMAEHRRHFGRPAGGFWLPECAFEPGLDAELARAGVRWTILDSHGLTHATPQPVHGVYAPVGCTSGVAAYGRDPESATEVWSAEAGYPGDPWYRDFHRDIGFDLPPDCLGSFASGDCRSATGLKYHRITGVGVDKEPYDPARARDRVAAHAADFVASRLAQVERLRRTMDDPPVIVCPYDAELFGHWWFEGPDWLDAVLRTLACTPGLEAVALSDDLAARPAVQALTPAASTWGWRGHQAVWLSPANEWVHPHLYATADRLVRVYRATRRPDAPRRRALTQALRELFLAQSSDWAFMMARETAVAYATRRTVEHLRACQALCDAVDHDTLDEQMVADLEMRHPVFPTLDVGVLG
jgi:1,4-alpha-glucan branching enzyme